MHWGQRQAARQSHYEGNKLGTLCFKLIRSEPMVMAWHAFVCSVLLHGDVQPAQGPVDTMSLFWNVVTNASSLMCCH